MAEVIGLFFSSGYDGEDSTYTLHAITILACWLADFAAEETGQDWLDTGFAPNGTTLRTIIGNEMRCLGPNGLLLPWDHYGWQRGINSAPFAFLARTSGSLSYLSLIGALDLAGLRSRQHGACRRATRS